MRCCPTYNSTPCLFPNTEQTVEGDDVDTIVPADTIYAPTESAANCIALEYGQSVHKQTVCDIGPTADDQTLEAGFNDPLNIVLTGFSPSGSTLLFLVQTQPVHGSLSGSGANLIYTPTFNYSGPDSFTFTVLSGDTESAPATVSITVLADYLANPAEFTIGFETPTYLTLTGSGPVDPLTWTITTPPTHGSLTGSGPIFQYTPDSGYDGPDSFEFTTGDGVESSVPALVSLTVLGELAFLADFITIQYAFQDGRDLDTYSQITGPESGDPLGWCHGSQGFVNGDLWYEWAGDNTGTGFESVLIYVNTIRTTNPTATILGDCKAWWYNLRETGDVTLRLTAYVGGYMELLYGEHRWINVGGSQTSFQEITNNVILNESACQDSPDCVSGWSYDIPNSQFNWTSCS